jgi:hypothetical protein
MKLAKEVLKKGQFEGLSLAVIGGGPSLRRFDFSSIKIPAIAVNMAARLAEVKTIFMSYVSDEKCVHLLEDLGWARWKMLRILWAGLKTMRIRENAGEYHCVDVNTLELWSSTLSGLPQGGNSGLAAYNLADILGASSIFLFGYDLRGENGKTANWHDDYPDRGGDSCYERMLEQFSVRVPSPVVDRTVVVGPSRLEEYGYKTISHAEWYNLSHSYR